MSESINLFQKIFMRESMCSQEVMRSGPNWDPGLSIKGQMAVLFLFIVTICSICAKNRNITAICHTATILALLVVILS